MSTNRALLDVKEKCQAVICELNDHANAHPEDEEGCIHKIAVMAEFMDRHLPAIWAYHNPSSL